MASDPWNFLKSLFGFSKEKSFEALEEPLSSLYGLIENNQVPGLAITVLKKGEQVFQEGFGFADIEKEIPVEPRNTLFRIASVSKCITGLALGKMLEEKIVDLDASFYTYVPDYPKKQFDFTLRQLANHTAGIRGYKGKEYALNKPYSIKESIQVFQNDPLEYEPGKGYLYNSFDFVLLSLAMEQASGIPFEDYVKEKVLKPLKLHNTITPNIPSKSSRAHSRDQEEVSTPFELTLNSNFSKAAFYTKWGGTFKKATEVNNFYKLAGGGYLSTVQDIALLGQAILEKQLLKPETYKELFTPVIVNGESKYYGLGFQVSEDKKGRHFVGHIGNQVGGYSNLFVYPKEEFVFVALTNCTDPKVQNSLDDVVDYHLNLLA